MKKMIGLVLGLGLWVILAVPAMANEGELVLRGTVANGPACKAASVYVRGSYQVLLTCRNLLTPYSAEITRYVAWYREGESRWNRLGVLENGKLSSQTNEAFTQIQITAEETSGPRTASDRVIVAGQLTEFDFGLSSITTTQPSVPSPTVTVSTEVTPGAVQNQGSVGQTIKNIGRALGIGFLLLLVGVVAMTFITRRRGLS
jgi:hypothetical protein